MRILITALPKCGTYLAGRLLEVFGFADSRLHLYEHYYQVHEQDRLVPHQAQLHDSVQLIPDGHFAYSHLHPTDYVRGVLRGNDIEPVVMIRGIADAVASYHDFVLGESIYSSTSQFTTLAAYLRSIPYPCSWILETVYGPEILQSFASWWQYPGASVVRFEDAILHRRTVIERLGNVLGKAPLLDIHDTIGSPTYRPGSKINRWRKILTAREVGRLEDDDYKRAINALGVADVVQPKNRQWMIGCLTCLHSAGDWCMWHHMPADGNCGQYEENTAWDGTIRR